MKQIKGEKRRAIRKYFNRIAFGYRDAKKYYGISKKTLQQIKKPNNLAIEVSDDEYDIIMKITQNKQSQRQMAVTEKLVYRTRTLIDTIGILELERLIGVNRSTLNSIASYKLKNTDIGIKEKIYALYCDIIKEDNLNTFDESCPNVNIKNISKRDAQKTIEESRKSFKALTVGKRYNIYQRLYDSAIQDKTLIFDGLITEEYRNYYLGENNGRKVTFLKNLLFLPDTIVEEVSLG